VGLSGTPIAPLARLLDGDFFLTLSIFRTRHQAPGLAIYLVARIFASGIKPDLSHSLEDLNRRDVPRVLRDGVGDEEVDIGAM
jgi:hypothetical protein